MNSNYDRQENTAAGQSSLLQSLLSNPAAITTILSLIKPKSETTPAAAPAGLFDSLAGGGGIGQLLSNPEFLEQLPTILAAVRPFLGQQNTSPPAATPAAVVYESEGEDRSIVEDDRSALAGTFNPAQLEGIGQLLGPSPSAHYPFGGPDKRRALLIALKPFIGAERGDAIDYIIKITELTEMFRKH